MQYIGEHLLPGQIGHFFAILSFVASFLATISFFKASSATLPTDKTTWLKFARGLFLIETISVLVVFSTLYYIISHHLFEYKYAWQHSDKSLQVEYLLSCFWEGQEGSFMLWSFWHCVLGWLLIWRAKEWEAGTLTVISFAQFCLSSMLVGFYFSGAKLGSSPFALLRHEGILDNAPIFQDIANGGLRSDYLTLIKDGQGLNTLLQNYWMVIHPPVLFLGFASTIVPFAFAFAGLMKKDHGWVKPALPWAAFSGGILGLGIMMGAAWAYESLSFGGYWAWDPVENASLVPWLVMVAGLHTNMIYKSTGYSLRSTYFFYILSFLLILYSTFLTRSGILGDTSVHAFTDLGMNTQLLLFLLVFVVPAFILYGIRYKSIPAINKEENSYSREFWMFIGSLVLFLSAILIIAKTSIPVYNKLFDQKIASSEDPEFAYNQVQVFVAIIIGILTAATQYLRFKDTPRGVFTKKIWLPTLISLVIGTLISVFGKVGYDKHGIGFLVAIHVAIFTAVYSVVANASYIWLGLKGKVKAAGASVAHVGFGLVLVGILISSSKRTVLSWNTTGIDVFQKDKREDPAENITLFKGITTDMGQYMVTYARDTFNVKERKRFFEINFASKTSDEHFSLYPDLIKNNKGNEGFAANPASKHYWYKDIFVYISFYKENNAADTATFRNTEVKVGDTLFYSSGLMILHKVAVNPPSQKGRYHDDETSLFLDMEVVAKDGRRYRASPGIALKGNELRNLPDSVVSQSLILQFNKVLDQQKGKLELGVKESAAITDLVTLKVYEFPMINILWIGVLVMVFGFWMSVYQRVRR
ncbi:cytochrome c biogenesis protein CcsA [Parasediminibacterium sp. JCM 36343]|uniref:cytochrome c biogenesis protein CcsA n=1 Tax=Parasediminibacterium sp. JCM 36343 TaxID=3374279 RepID=UPI00397CA31B